MAVLSLREVGPLLLRILAVLRSKGVVSGLVASTALKILWDQYSMLFRWKTPKYRFELPIFGGNLSLMWKLYQPWAQSIEDPVRFTSLFGVNTAIVSWPIYEEHVRKADMGGLLDQGGFPEGMVKLIGDQSLLMMKAGRGQHKHAHLRSKILASMTPKRMLSLVPDMITVIREELDSMATRNPSPFLPRANVVAARISSIPIIGGLAPELQKLMLSLFQTWMLGLMSVPIDLGRFSPYGRAMKARREIGKLIKEFQKTSRGDASKTALGELTQSSETGDAVTETELLDSIFTLLFAGQATTQELLPCLLVEMSQRPDWRAKIAAEPLAFDALEADSATLRFVREVMRLYPPEVMIFRRSLSQDLSLGKHGVVPRGCNLALNFGRHMWSFGQDTFDPDRWAPRDTEREYFLPFGGHSPHSCVGRSLAILELQVFCRIVAREYDLEMLDATRVRNWALGGIFYKYKDDLMMHVTRK